ncbi:unnamed protein product, partial [Rotaria sp. Silwood2]
MVDYFDQDKRTVPLTVIDLFRESNRSVGTREVKLYDTGLDIEIRSTFSNSNDAVVVFLNTKQDLDAGTFLKLFNGVNNHYTYFQSFEDVDQCIDFISSITFEKVFLILLLSEAEHLIPLVSNIPQLINIYVCDEQDKSNIDYKKFNWLNNFPSVRNRIYK